MKILFKLKYTLYDINKRIDKLTIKYNNWQDNVDWITGAIEINPNIEGLEILKEKKKLILNKYNILRETYPELPLILQPESKLSIILFKIKILKQKNYKNKNIIQTV